MNELGASRDRAGLPHASGVVINGRWFGEALLRKSHRNQVLEVEGEFQGHGGGGVAQVGLKTSEWLCGMEEGSLWQEQRGQRAQWWEMQSQRQAGARSPGQGRGLSFPQDHREPQ